MNGTIRIIAGFVITLGAVGTLDVDPTASVIVQAGIALIGIAILAWGAFACRNQ